MRFSFLNIYVQSVREHQENILMEDYSAFKEQIKTEQDYIWTSAELRAALYDADIIYFSSTFSCVNSTGKESIGEKGKLPHLGLFRIKWLKKAYLNDVAD